MDVSGRGEARRNWRIPSPEVHCEKRKTPRLTKQLNHRSHSLSPYVCVVAAYEVGKYIVYIECYYSGGQNPHKDRKTKN